jgi:hypothetical protein
MLEARPCHSRDRGLLKPKDLELPSFDFENTASSKISKTCDEQPTFSTVLKESRVKI